MKCLTCDAAAVADCLCVECGARLWASTPRTLIEVAEARTYPEQEPRARAIDEMRNRAKRDEFAAALDAAWVLRRAEEKAITRHNFERM